MAKRDSSKKIGLFSTRELELIANCRGYALNKPAGLPGHNVFIIVSKLVDILDVLIPIAPAEDVNALVKIIGRRYDREGGEDPGQALFEQIKDMTKARNFIRRDVVGPRRTAEQIAESQGRCMIYICPDGTYRNHNAEIVGKRGDNLHGGPFSDCIPFSFGSESDFTDWVNSILDEAIGLLKDAES